MSREEMIAEALEKMDGEVRQRRLAHLKPTAWWGVTIVEIIEPILADAARKLMEHGIQSVTMPYDIDGYRLQAAQDGNTAEELIFTFRDAAHNSGVQVTSSNTRLNAFWSWDSRALITEKRVTAVVMNFIRSVRGLPIKGSGVVW